MQNYQQYVSLPARNQQPSNHQPSPLLARGDMRTRGLYGTCSRPALGYISIKPPASLMYQIQPGNFTYGFNSSGNLVGANQELSYPSFSRKYHQHPFSRSADWYTTSVLGGASLSDVVKRRQASPRQEVSMETAEYFTTANDEGYENWVAKQSHEQQVKVNVVPADIKALPGHANPSSTETTNEVYGQYLDLKPKYPAVYPLATKLPPTSMQVLVKFRHSNMSDHKPIPDHTFAVDPREMMTKDGCYTRGIHGAVYLPQGSDPQTKTAFSFRQNEVILGQPVGERAQGFTLPLYAPTGLELNRPPSLRTVSVVAGVDGKKRFRTLLPARAVPHIYSRYMSYSSAPGHDLQTEQNPARPQQKLMCAPFAACSQSESTCDPCSLKFINPQLLPVPAELRKPPCC